MLKKKRNLLKWFIFLILFKYVFCHELMLNHLESSEVPNNSKSMDLLDLLKESTQELFKNAPYSPILFSLKSILTFSVTSKGAEERKQCEEGKKKKSSQLSTLRDIQKFSRKNLHTNFNSFSFQSLLEYVFWAI